MCLLIALAGVDPEHPLVVGANRDEYLDRPATPMTVLRPAGPRIVGGRDERAGGTWFAVNEHGVVAGLTNRPSERGSDTTKRSRGELPIALARHTTAASAVEAFAGHFRPADYNPAWLLVGDRTSLFTIDMTDGDAPTVRALGPGIHILENAPHGERTDKVDRVRSLVAGADDLERALADESACIHLDGYGTRWSAVVEVPRDASTPPRIRYADGPPCSTPYQDASEIWASRSGSR